MSSHHFSQFDSNSSSKEDAQGSARRAKRTKDNTPPPLEVLKDSLDLTVRFLNLCETKIIKLETNEEAFEALSIRDLSSLVKTVMMLEDTEQKYELAIQEKEKPEEDDILEKLFFRSFDPQPNSTPNTLDTPAAMPCASEVTGCRGTSHETGANENDLK